MIGYSSYDREERQLRKSAKQSLLQEKNINAFIAKLPMSDLNHF